MKRIKRAVGKDYSGPATAAGYSTRDKPVSAGDNTGKSKAEGADENQSS
ncbi:hypothetical protein [Prolixibacter sp. NT017]|nr:hypothetical protein [Prolixibacter sp. NT017]